MSTGLVAVIMIFSIPIIAIVTQHFQEKSKIKSNTIQEQIELEKLKQENFLLETEKMRLELEKMQLGYPKEEQQKLIK